MCGRFTLRTPTHEWVEQLGLPYQHELPPRFNIAPTQLVPIIRKWELGVEQLRWGLVPFWAKDAKSAARMINARSETVATKPAFRAALKRQRCLVPSDGYFEWRKEGKRKQPYWIQMQDGGVFLMAGLWDRWKGEGHGEDKPLETFTILTTTANELTAPIHDRMPVILGPNDYDVWLDHDRQDAKELDYLWKPTSSDELKMQPVSTYVNSVKHDDEKCIEPPRELFE